MFIVLLWLGIFVDVLSSFSLLPARTIQRISGGDSDSDSDHDSHYSYLAMTSSSSKTKTKTNTENSSASSSYDLQHAEETAVTLLIPPAIPKGNNDDDQEFPYPSPLHYLHVRSLLTPQEAMKACTISQDYATQTNAWDTPDGVRHASYPTCDFPVDDCDALAEYLEQIGFDDRLFATLSDLYGINMEDMEYLDLFVAHYQAKNDNEEGKTTAPSSSSSSSSSSRTMDRLELHRDGSLLSFSLLLNSPTDFTGGGTFYDALRDDDESLSSLSSSSSSSTPILYPGGVIRPTHAGDACLHCGKLLHGADTVISGQRTVLVGFVDVDQRCYRPGVLAQACTEWGRMDVAAHRHRRQLKMLTAGTNNNNNNMGNDDSTTTTTTTGGGGGGWTLTNAPFLPQVKTGGRPPHVQGFVPGFASATRRADPAYQRRKKLETEDVLLRSILLPSEERPPPNDNDDTTDEFGDFVEVSWDEDGGDGSITIL
jgi:hypothetical protein